MAIAIYCGNFLQCIPTGILEPIQVCDTSDDLFRPVIVSWSTTFALCDDTVWIYVPPSFLSNTVFLPFAVNCVGIPLLQ